MEKNKETELREEYYKARGEEVLKRKLIQFEMAYTSLVEAMNNIYVDENDFICVDYPFEKSFDEYNVVEWVDKSVNKINKKQLRKGVQYER